MAGLSGCSDMIVLSHVLEHVFDVRSTIASLLDILTPEGRLYIEVSDPARYDAAAYPPFYFFDSEHINHLDEVALRNLASMVGLAVEKIGKKFITLQNGSAYPAIYGTLVRNEIPPQSGFSPPDLGRTLAGYIEDSTRTVTGAFGKCRTFRGVGRWFLLTASPEPGLVSARPALGYRRPRWQQGRLEVHGNDNPKPGDGFEGTAFRHTRFMCRCHCRR